MTDRARKGSHCSGKVMFAGHTSQAEVLIILKRHARRLRRHRLKGIEQWLVGVAESLGQLVVVVVRGALDEIDE